MGEVSSNNGSVFKLNVINTEIKNLKNNIDTLNYKFDAILYNLWFY